MVPIFFPPPLAEFRRNFSHGSSSSTGKYIVTPSALPKFWWFVPTRDLFNRNLYHLWVSLEIELAHQIPFLNNLWCKTVLTNYNIFQHSLHRKKYHLYSWTFCLQRNHIKCLRMSFFSRCPSTHRIQDFYF